MKEIWKDIPNYKGLYQASNLGNIRSLHYRRTNKIKQLAYRINHKGYLDTHIKNKRKTIHRLVAETFIPNPNNLPQINHIDGNKLNNNITNLEWCDNGKNQKHAYRLGLQHSKKGVNHSRCRKVNQYDLDGNFIKTWSYIKEASDCLNIHHSNIISCCKGLYKKTGNYIWRYADK